MGVGGPESVYFQFFLSDNSEWLRPPLVKAVPNSENIREKSLFLLLEGLFVHIKDQERKVASFRINRFWRDRHSA
jgi:hypothetical protein